MSIHKPHKDTELFADAHRAIQVKLGWWVPLFKVTLMWSGRLEADGKTVIRAVTDKRQRGSV